MTNQSITNRPEFIGELPDSLTLEPNSQNIIITNRIRNSKIQIKEGSKTTIVALLNQGWKEKQFLNFDFEGENSELTFLALIVAKNEDEFPFETISNHKVPNTNGYYYVRGAQFDKSIVDYRGVLVIKPGAQITDSYLAHHTLLLSKEAKTYTIPSLEIEADDVAAGHAATIGKVDEELLFYLASRGINKKKGQDMLIQGFMESDLNKIPNEEIQKLLSQEVQSHFK